MLVADSRRRSNPRVLYGILAESALEQLNAQAAEATERRAYFENLIRLLEMYRYNALRRVSPRAVLDRRQSDLRARQRERLANEAVERALDAAREASFVGMDRAQMVEQLTTVFVRLMNDEPDSVSQADRNRVRQFLEVFAAALRT